MASRRQITCASTMIRASTRASTPPTELSPSALSFDWLGLWQGAVCALSPNPVSSARAAHVPHGGGGSGSGRGSSGGRQRLLLFLKGRAVASSGHGEITYDGSKVLPSLRWVDPANVSVLPTMRRFFEFFGTWKFYRGCCGAGGCTVLIGGRCPRHRSLPRSRDLSSARSQSPGRPEVGDMRGAKSARRKPRPRCLVVKGRRHIGKDRGGLTTCSSRFRKAAGVIGSFLHVQQRSLRARD
mmetsp:Transcript_24612/g.57133  ORF Transcript_24612/g.57133 Transcript_24612/m.57133 type:complete len:240 (+) Transcript_24612:1086-1805(+)